MEALWKLYPLHRPANSNWLSLWALLFRMIGVSVALVLPLTSIQANPLDYQSVVSDQHCDFIQTVIPLHHYQNCRPIISLQTWSPFRKYAYWCLWEPLGHLGQHWWKLLLGHWLPPSTNQQVIVLRSRKLCLLSCAWLNLHFWNCSQFY
jgi:hypothetical protein